MKVHVDPSALQRTRWFEYALRFFFGGLITAVTGLIAKKYGPEVGGLFLAFPAIFPATATLIEKHEQQKKQRLGVEGRRRARAAAGVDAAGTAMGCLGLVAFGLVVWTLLPNESLWLVLGGATLTWLGVALLTWIGCEQIRVLRRWRAHVQKVRARKRAATLSGG